VNVRDLRFPLVDSLRAIAALSVVAAHAAFPAGIYEDDFLRQFVTRLDVGVTIFFLISGFLLYRPFVRARFVGEGQPSTGAYAWRRFLRIVPAYWVALTIIAYVQLDHSEIFSTHGFFTYYCFGQVYRPETGLGGIPQAWTLCVEVAFYAMLPIWALAVRRLPGGSPRELIRWELVALALLALASLVYKVVLVEHNALDNSASGPYMLSLPQFLDQFAIGMALAVASVWWSSREKQPRAVRLVDQRPGIAWLVAFLAFVAASTLIGLTGEFGEHIDRSEFFLRHYLFTVVAIGLLLPAFFGDPANGLVRRVLANRVLLWLGVVSYGIYLWHSAVYEQLTRWRFGEVTEATHRYVWFFAAAALSALVAAVSYYVVERPALKLKRLVGRREPGLPGEAVREPAPVIPGGGTGGG
jgi:peptidoglycan/LPS O-acetylase OafA/YrhL